MSSLSKFFLGGWARHDVAPHPAKVHYIQPRSQRASGLFFQLCAVLRGWGGAEGIRTPDLRRAKAALSRLSYGPASVPERLEQPTVEWASLESNQGPQSYQDCALAD